MWMWVFCYHFLIRYTFKPLRPYAFKLILSLYIEKP